MWTVCTHCCLALHATCQQQQQQQQREEQEKPIIANELECGSAKMSTSDKAADKAAGPCCKHKQGTTYPHSLLPLPPAKRSRTAADAAKVQEARSVDPNSTECEANSSEPARRREREEPKREKEREEERARATLACKKRFASTCWDPQVLSKTLTFFGLCHGEG